MEKKKETKTQSTKETQFEVILAVQSSFLKEGTSFVIKRYHYLANVSQNSERNRNKITKIITGYEQSSFGPLCIDV